MPCDANNLIKTLSSIGSSAVQICLWFFVLLCVCALFGSGLQTQFRIASKALQPQWNRLSLREGIKRVFAVRNGVEFLKSVGKLALIITIAWVIFRQGTPSLRYLSPLPPGYILQETSRFVLWVVFSLMGAMGILAALDYGYQKARIFRSLYMSRKEMKDEMRDLEGDPLVAFRQRQMQRELAQMRSLPNKIPQATVIITNPTHYAVALRWVPGETTAPKVVAKGMDRVAQRIRALARENFVPLVENPPLARLLYSSVQVDEEILPEHYRAVAEVIRHVLRITKKPQKT